MIETVLESGSRRRFVFLLGGAASGVWLSGIGLLALQRRFALTLGGRCSFCSKSGAHVGVRALTGVVYRPARICDDCVRLCGVILAEQSVAAGDWRKKIPDLRCSFCGADRRDVAKLIAGPRVFICDGCTGEATALLATVLPAARV